MNIIHTERRFERTIGAKGFVSRVEESEKGGRATLFAFRIRKSMAYIFACITLLSGSISGGAAFNA